MDLTFVQSSVIEVEDGGPNSDEDEILTSTRIKQRRATVAPTEIPTVQLPRYLRDPGRYSNKTRRQSMPAQYITSHHGQLPSIRLATEKSSICEEVDTCSDKEPTIREQAPKSPVKICNSFPLDYRLQNGQNSNRCDSGTTLEINTSLETLSTSSKASPDLIIPQIGIDNRGKSVGNLELTIGYRSSQPNKYKQGSLNPSYNKVHSDKIRRHSISVSVLSDSNRIRSERPLPGMADLENMGRSLCKSRDRIISVPSGDDLESGRHEAEPKIVSWTF